MQYVSSGYKTASYLLPLLVNFLRVHPRTRTRLLQVSSSSSKSDNLFRPHRPPAADSCARKP